MAANQSGADVCVIGGGGHVGLPLGLVMAEQGMKVLLYDINDSVLKLLAQAKVPFMEDGAEELLRKMLDAGRIILSSDPRDIANIPTLIVTIGTPVDEFHNPILKLMQTCFDELMPHLSDGQHLILRSTVYPGTTNWLANYLEAAGRKMLVSFCPERVIQGHSLREIRTLPQIISGITDEALEKATELFNRIAPEVVVLKPIEAEFAKLFNNAYRYLEFAITNEFYMITDSAGVDYHRVLEGMRKNYPRAQHMPKPGFAAGPCLFKDTMQLAAFSNNRFSLGQAAVMVNEGLVLYVVNEIEKTHDLSNTTVGLLGMSFKANNDDTRSSLSYKLKKILQFRAKGVLTTDPHVTTDPELWPVDHVIKNSDLLILCVPHSAYANLDTNGKNVVDIWGYVKKAPQIDDKSLQTPFAASGTPATLSGVQSV